MMVISEPSFPSMQTTVPGPLTNATKSEIDVISNARTARMVIDYDKSSVNYQVCFLKLSYMNSCDLRT